MKFRPLAVASTLCVTWMFALGSSAAELAVLPFLYGRGIDRLDKLIVSHGDLDHAGGVQAIASVVDIDEILVGETLSGVNQTQKQCVAGDQWRWDAVTFSILHPRKNAPWKRNNSSCVLLVEVGRFRLLLTGDIESHDRSISCNGLKIKMV